jgi:hypothetical protein
MIIYYFNFYFLLFLIYKDIILIFLFSTRLVNGFKSDKLLNPIIDPPDQNPASAPDCKGHPTLFSADYFLLKFYYDKLTT